MMQVRNKIRVVIADRDLFYLQKLKLCLERRGDMVVVGMADNGPAVFQMVQEGAPDVLLMDVILGEKDGVWVLEQMKAQKKECVCIMISRDRQRYGGTPSSCYGCRLLYGKTHTGRIAAGTNPSIDRTDSFL